MSSQSGPKKALVQHNWWGNIRELHSVALRYFIFGDTLEKSYDALFDIADQNQKTPSSTRRL